MRKLYQEDRTIILVMTEAPTICFEPLEWSPGARRGFGGLRQQRQQQP